MTRRPRAVEGASGFFRALLSGALLLLALPTPGAALDPGQEAVPGDTIQLLTGSLEAASLAFAGALSEGSGDGFPRLLAGGSIRLHLDGSGHTGLSSRQAVASLREFLRGYDGGAALVTRAAPVEGSPDRGFAEILWSARVSGTSHEVRRTVFLSLYREGREWRVDEVRLMR